MKPSSEVNHPFVPRSVDSVIANYDTSERSDRTRGFPPRAFYMSLSEFNKRSVVWSCLAILTLVTGLGQSLHHFAGIRHSCECATPAPDSFRHTCADNGCPFVESASEESQNSDGTSPTSPDCCSVCRLLANLNNGSFSLPAATSHLQAVSGEVVHATVPCVL
jgi:hypothetical protein